MLREPLVHFLVLGALVFAGYAWSDRDQPVADGDSRIVIDQAELDHLKSLWKLQWKRDPAPGDVAAIIQRYLRQEVFYREALRMKLDHNDEIIKRRMAQKMEAVASDLGTLMRPATDQQLRAFFESERDLFMLPQAYAFRQVLFLPDEKGAAEAMLASLRQGGSVPQDRRSKLGVPDAWELSSVRDLGNAFGGEFTQSLAELPLNEWAGPVRSGYGWHLVYLEQNQPPTLPDFELARDFVAREYQYRSVLETQDQVFRELRDRYDIVITASDVPPDIRREYPPQ